MGALAFAASQKWNTSMKRRGTTALNLGRRVTVAAVTTLVAVIVVHQMFPLAVLVLTGLREPIAVMRDGIFASTGWSLGQFFSLFSEHNMGRALVHSWTIALVSSSAAVLFGAALVFACTQLVLPGSRALLLSFVCFRLVPPAALIIPIFVFLNVVGLADSMVGMILVHTAMNLPFGIWLLYPFFRAIPADIRHAAEVDGLHPLTMFWRIHLPLVAPGAAAAGIFCFLLSWNDFLLALVLAGSNVRTAPIVVNGFMTGFGPEWGLMAASALVILVPVFVLSFVLQRFLASGMTEGSVK